MKNFILLFIIYSFISCSKSVDIDNIVLNKWKECGNNSNCNIDFASEMGFEWDTMCYYSGENSLEEINKDLGFDLKEFTDVGDRIIFLNKGKIVYHKEWFKDPEKQAKGVVFLTNLRKFKLKKTDAIFNIKKNGLIYYLEKPPLPHG